MAICISDRELRALIEQNASAYPSHMALIQATVRMLWPEGPPADGPERVVRACLGLAPTAAAKPARGSDLVM